MLWARLLLADLAKSQGIAPMGRSCRVGPGAKRSLRTVGLATFPRARQLCDSRPVATCVLRGTHHAAIQPDRPVIL